MILKKLITSLLVSVFILSMTFSWACLGNLKGDCDQDRLQDGSCLISADQLRIREKAQDGSCQLAADQLRIREKAQDGSCLM